MKYAFLLALFASSSLYAAGSAMEGRYKVIDGNFCIQKEIEIKLSNDELKVFAIYKNKNDIEDSYEIYSFDHINAGPKQVRKSDRLKSSMRNSHYRITYSDFTTTLEEDGGTVLLEHHSQNRIHPYSEYMAAGSNIVARPAAWITRPIEIAVNLIDPYQSEETHTMTLKDGRLEHTMTLDQEGHVDNRNCNYQKI